MKRNDILWAVGLSVLLISGCAEKGSQLSYLGIEEVKQLALKEAGFSANEVEFTETSLNSRSGIDYYQVDFTAAGETYQYDLDAMTGVIIDANVPSADTESALDTKAAEPTESAGSSEKTDQIGNTGNADEKMLTSEEAKAKALAHAGLTSDQVTFLKSMSENEDGRLVYDVEFYSEDKKEYDYEIDAYTGEVLSFDYDAENYASSPSASGTMLTAEEAKELALERVPGAAAKDIFEFEADYDDGHTEYEGKIVYNGMEYEFEIDAYSGTFRSWESEPVDD